MLGEGFLVHLTGEEIVVHLTVPGFDASGTVAAHPDVVVHAVAAVFIPNMRVEGVVDRDVVVNMAVESLAQLNTASEAEVVVNFVMG